MTGLLAAIASALVIIGTLGAWARRGFRLLRQRIQARGPDHLPIWQGPWQVHMPPDAEGDHVRLLAVVAPSDSLDEPDLDLTQAADFARDSLGFDGVPVYSSVRDGLRMARTSEDATFEHVWIGANGRLELSIYLPIAVDAAGIRELDVVPLLVPLRRLACSVCSTKYATLYRLGKRRVPRYFDWRIGVSVYSTDADNMHHAAWQALTFPGEQPSRLVQRKEPFCPIEGYGTDALTSWDSRRPDSALLAGFLRSFLAENGYDVSSAAISEAVAAAAS